MSEFINRPQVEAFFAADGDRRRYWSDDDKLCILEESFIDHRQAAATAPAWHWPITADYLAAAVSER